MFWFSHLFQNFPQFILIHTVKGFGIVNKVEEIDVFLELSCFFDDPADIGNLISGSSAFSKTFVLVHANLYFHCVVLLMVFSWGSYFLDHACWSYQFLSCRSNSSFLLNSGYKVAYILSTLPQLWFYPLYFLFCRVSFFPPRTHRWHSNKIPKC